MSADYIRTTVRCALVVLATALLTSCGQAGTNGSTRANGPLGMSSGQSALDTGNVSLDFGQTADDGVDIVNSGDAPVRITAVSLVPIDGEPDGHLAHVAIVVHGSAIGAGRFWPPQGVTKKLSPVIDAMVPPGASQIIIGITGQPGVRHYAVAGLRIDYVYRNRSYTSIAWGALAACFESDWQTGSSCSAFGTKVNTTLERMAALS